MSRGTPGLSLPLSQQPPEPHHLDGSVGVRLQHHIATQVPVRANVREAQNQDRGRGWRL